MEDYELYYERRSDCPFAETGVRYRLKRPSDYDIEQLLKIIECKQFTETTPKKYLVIFEKYDDIEFEMLEWCVDNLVHRFGMTQALFGYFHIENGEDAMKFQLRFPEYQVMKMFK